MRAVESFRHGVGEGVFGVVRDLVGVGEAGGGRSRATLWTYSPKHSMAGTPLLAIASSKQRCTCAHPRYDGRRAADGAPVLHRLITTKRDGPIHQ